LSERQMLSGTTGGYGWGCLLLQVFESTLLP